MTMHRREFMQQATAACALPSMALLAGPKPQAPRLPVTTPADGEMTPCRFLFSSPALPYKTWPYPRADLERPSALLQYDLLLCSTFDTMLLDLIAVGVVYSMPRHDFKRYVACKKCRHEVRWYDFAWQGSGFSAVELAGGQWVATCRECDHRGDLLLVDRVGARTNLQRRLHPREIVKAHDPLNQTTAYIWRIPDDYRRLVITGHPHTWQFGPQEVLQAAAHGRNFCFHDGVITEWNVFHNVAVETLDGKHVALEWPMMTQLPRLSGLELGELPLASGRYQVHEYVNLSPEEFHGKTGRDPARSHTAGTTGARHFIDPNAPGVKDSLDLANISLGGACRPSAF